MERRAVILVQGLQYSELMLFAANKTKEPSENSGSFNKQYISKCLCKLCPALRDLPKEKKITQKCILTNSVLVHLLRVSLWCM